jgi:hypothetical protein
MRFFWIPEAPNHPGVYANSNASIEADGDRSTTDPHAALRFPDRMSCQLWCDSHPVPPFVPQEHGFAEPADLEQINPSDVGRLEDVL